MLKWLGAVLIVAACGGSGFWAGLQLRRQERELRELKNILDFLENELCYHQSPLPELLEKVVRFDRSAVTTVLTAAAQQMCLQQFSDAEACVRLALVQHPVMDLTHQILLQMGRSMGQFDLEGQQAALQQVSAECSRLLQLHCTGLEQRMQTYRVLGLCAGGALAILLL